MHIAIVGLGYWGPNLVRNFSSQPEVTRVTCVDLDEKRLRAIKAKFPHVETTSDYAGLLASGVDAVAIATPVSTHHRLAKQALEAGVHVILEKPMTATTAEAEDLVETAERKGLTLMVDHTFIYTGAVRKMKEIVDRGELGDLYYFDSVRVNLGLFQHDVNVIWDLAPHDLSIMGYVLGNRPARAVSAVGSCHVGNGLEDIAYLTVMFDDALIAHFHVNWLAPVKVRRTLLGGSKRMIVYDDMEASEKIKVYDKGINVTTREGIYETLIQYRTGDMYAPKLDQTEALALIAAEFIRCIQTPGSIPATDGRSGLDVVRILEASEQSIKQGGKLIQL